MRRNITLSLFFTLVLSLIVIYALYPLNRGAAALVFFLCAGFVLLVQVVIRAFKKRPDEK